MADRLTQRLRAGERRPAGDAGVTLIDLVVAMGLMGIFMAMFTAATLQIYGTVNRTEAISDAQSQVNLAMTRLDKEIRYASEISEPGSVGGDPVVEFLTTHTGPKVCHQVRLDVDQQRLQRRSWPENGTPPLWQNTPPLVAHISAAQFGSDPEEDAVMSRLTVRLTATPIVGDPDLQKETVVTFTAQNSTSSQPTSACQAGRTAP